jgi:hypothetical protein
LDNDSLKNHSHYLHCLNKGGRTTLFDGLIIGCRGDLVICDDPEVSDEHCHFEIDGDNATITDHGSNVGTIVKRKKLKAGKAHSLSEGNIIEISSQVYVYSSQMILEGAGLEGQTRPWWKLSGEQKSFSLVTFALFVLSWVFLNFQVFSVTKLDFEAGFSLQVLLDCLLSQSVVIILSLVLSLVLEKFLWPHFSKLKKWGLRSFVVFPIWFAHYIFILSIGMNFQSRDYEKWSMYRQKVLSYEKIQNQQMKTIYFEKLTDFVKTNYPTSSLLKNDYMSMGGEADVSKRIPASLKTSHHNK